MNAELYITIPVALLCLVMAIVILCGKGDMLISGYNTASPEERAQYNIHRLRLVMGVAMIIVALTVAITSLVEGGEKWSIPILIPTIIGVLVFGNIWAKN